MVEQARDVQSVPTIHPAKILPIQRETDIVLARQEGRALAQKVGFSAVDQARVTTAISELARNILVYSQRGQVTLRQLDGADRVGIEMEFDDDGPGIADLEQAMTQGFTTGKGLGAGLPGSKRLMDEFEIRTAPGAGVHIKVRKWK